MSKQCRQSLLSQTSQAVAMAAISGDNSDKLVGAQAIVSFGLKHGRDRVIC
jgi:hypothetical protein